MLRAFLVELLLRCTTDSLSKSDSSVPEITSIVGLTYAVSSVEQFIGVFMDLQQKSMNSEISTKPLDLRGLLAAMKIVRTGLSPWQAVRMGIVNKTFDVFEKEIVEDVVRTRIPLSWTWEDVYGR